MVVPNQRHWSTHGKQKLYQGSGSLDHEMNPGTLKYEPRLLNIWLWHLDEFDTVPLKFDTVPLEFDMVCLKFDTVPLKYK